MAPLHYLLVSASILGGRGASAAPSPHVTDIHVVFSNHLDVGFNERSWNMSPSERCEGLFSPDGERCMPLAANVTSEYFNVYFPRAAAMADAARAKGGDRYIYMAQPWVIALFLDCAGSGVNDWRPGHTSDALLTCPNASTVTQFKRAVRQGDIFFQAFPHSSCPESYDASQFEASLGIGARLADQLGVPRPKTFSQRDETGMSRAILAVGETAILPLLNKHGVRYISLGSGGGFLGHPVLPGSRLASKRRNPRPAVFRWLDEASGAEVLMAADHGYGGGLHVLPSSGAALYCAWNRDNSGPSAKIFNSTLATLRAANPGANVFASTLDEFFRLAEEEKHLLPTVTQEIGDTWLYGVPTDPRKNTEFREVGRRRLACVSAGGGCDPTSIDFVRFDRLLSLIPEHTWGLDTTFYLGDYGNWSNAQLESNLGRPNYQLTVESWQEQRSYVKNAILALNTTGPHGALRAELLDALAALAPRRLAAARAELLKSFEVVEEGTTAFHCNQTGASIAFAPDGSIASVSFHQQGEQPAAAVAAAGGGRLGQVRYQTLSEDNFTTFDSLYTGGCLNRSDGTTETISCHNFAKPNMSSAYGGDHAAGYGVHSPAMTKLWRSKDKGSCAFVTEAEFAAPLYTRNGAPRKVISSVAITPAGLLEVNVSAINKTASRLPEALWVSFKPPATRPGGWKLRYYGTTDVKPTDVVEHGAVHLHALGPDGSVVHSAPEGGETTVEIVSLDVPVVSAGLLSPFPAALDGSVADNSTALIEGWIEEGGWHYNVQNQIWNTNYPQWYPFDKEDTEILSRFVLRLKSSDDMAVMDHTFVERSSVRRYFGASKPPQNAVPWASVALTGVAQLEPARGGRQAQWWVLEQADAGSVHKVWLLSHVDSGTTDGEEQGTRVEILQPVTVNGTALVVPSGSRLVTGSADGAGTALLIVAQPSRVLWLKCGSLGGASCRQTASATSLPPASVLAAAAAGEQLWLGTTRGLALCSGAGATPQLLNVSGGDAVLAVATAGSDFVSAATAQTLWRGDHHARTWSHMGVGGVIDSNITALRYFSPGAHGIWSLAIGTRHALHVIDPNGVVARFSGLQGLPVAGITSLHSAGGQANASLWIGTTQGLVEMFSPDGSTAIGAKPEWRYYNGDRWLVGSGVAATSVVVAVAELRASEGKAIVAVATPGGLAEISLKPISYEDKAAHYESMVSPQHDRYGWTAQVPLARKGDRDSYVLTDGDNDGSNTGYYMASLIFHYQVTKSADALAKSWRAFAAMEFLHNVTRPFSKQPGFIARTAVRCGEPHQGPSGGVCGVIKGHCGPTVNASCSGCSPPAGSCTGFACPGWANSSECFFGEDPAGAKTCCWSFKSDTSTDETDGHFYALQIAYDQLAQAEHEKVRIARLLCNTASYIVDNDFVLLDPLTGNRTSWGYWSPDILNGIGVGSSNGVGNNGKPNERGLNSLEILSYMSVAHKICHAHPAASPPLRQPATGSYGDALALLLDHGYGENILNVHLSNPGYDNQGIAWFDFGNSFYTYYSFSSAAPWLSTVALPASLTVAKLARLKQQFFAGFEAYWAARSYSASAEHDGLWSVIYTAVTGRPGNADPLWVLRRGPRELVDWPARNSQRLDINLRKDWLECCNTNLSVTPLPPDESPDMHYEDDSPYPLDGGDAMFEAAPVVFLHTYWMARFYNVSTDLPPLS